MSKLALTIQEAVSVSGLSRSKSTDFCEIASSKLARAATGR